MRKSAYVHIVFSHMLFLYIVAPMKIIFRYSIIRMVKRTRADQYYWTSPWGIQSHEDEFMSVPLQP